MANTTPTSFSPRIPIPLVFDVRKRIQQLHGFLDRLNHGTRKNDSTSISELLLGSTGIARQMGYSGYTSRTERLSLGRKRTIESLSKRLTMADLDLDGSIIMLFFPNPSLMDKQGICHRHAQKYLLTYHV